MSDQENGNNEDKLRQGSVKELILRTERRAKSPYNNSTSPSPRRSLSKRLSKTVARAKTTVARRGKGKNPPTPPIKPIVYTAYPKGTLQHELPHAIEVHNKRLQAKYNYLEQQKQLQREYEEKIRDLHQGFVKHEASLVHTFPSEKTAEAEKKVKTIEKLRKDIKDEKDEKIKGKLQTEVKKLEEEVLALRLESEVEFDKMKGMWLSISASQWDMLLSHPNTRQPYGYNQRNYGIFEAIRRKDDFDVSNPIGAQTKNQGRKVQLGNATYWTLGQIVNEENTLNGLKQKKQNRLHQLTRKVIKLAGANDNKTNREKVMKVFKDKGHKALRDAVNVLGKQLDNKALTKLAMEESRMDRVVIVRVTKVDRTSEQLKLVMVLDRNGRPCAGGLPPSETKKLSIYDGADKFISKKESEQPPPPPAVTNNAQSLIEALRNLPVPEETVEEDETDDSEEEEEDTENNANEVVNTTEEEANDAPPTTTEATENPAPVQEEEEENHIQGYCTIEKETTPSREYTVSLSEILGCEEVSVIADDMKVFFKDRYNTYIPHITYQRISGFQVFNNDLTANNNNTNNNNNNDNSNFGFRFGGRRRRDHYDDAGDFQIVDLGIKLGLDPLIPLEEYDQVWRNGMLHSLKHRQDGPIRFVGFNETGFGFMEDRPIDMHVQKIEDKDGNVTGVNIMHMTLYDMNDQICFDTLYLKDDEDMKANKSWRVFGKDAIGNRLAYRIVAQKGEIKAILYPFQGRVKRAKLNVKDVTELKPGDWVNVVVTGQTSKRLARVKLMPTGMVVGKIDVEKKSGCSPTPFVEMIRERQRAFAEMPGLVDLEIFCEDNQLLKEVRTESWPVECCQFATEEDMKFMKSLELEKEEQKAEVEKTILSLVSDAKNFVADRSKRSNLETFLQEADNLNKLLVARKNELGEHELLSEINEAINLLEKNVMTAKRAAAFRKSKQRSSTKNVTKDV